MLERFDVISGTVVGNHSKYAIVNCADGCKVRCRALLPIGTKGIFTITSYAVTAEGTVYFAELDSVVYDAA